MYFKNTEFNNKEKQSIFFKKVKENVMVRNDLRYLLSGYRKYEIAQELIPYTLVSVTRWNGQIFSILDNTI